MWYYMPCAFSHFILKQLCLADTVAVLYDKSGNDISQEVVLVLFLTIRLLASVIQHFKTFILLLILREPNY